MASRSVLSKLLLATLVVALPALDTAWSDSLPDPRAPGDGFLHFPGIPPIPIPPRPNERGDIGASGTIAPAPNAQGFGNPSAGQPPKRARVAQPTPPKVLTQAEKAEAIRKALAPKPPISFVRRHALDELYAKLTVARDEEEAKGLATLIGGIWMRSDSDTANLLMQRVVTAIEAKNYPLAQKILDRLVEVRPDWAEAWNKRASVRFFAGDMDGAMSDVDHVLKLEPRHFGALDGMATILERTGFRRRALEVYRRALVIYPHQTTVEKIVEKLTLEVEGQGI